MIILFLQISSFSTNHNIENITGINSNTIYSIGQHITDTSGVIGKYIFDAFAGGVATYEQSFTGPTTFNRIYAYDENNVVAVGNDYIAYTKMVEILTVPDGIYFRILVLIYMMYIYQF